MGTVIAFYQEAGTPHLITLQCSSNHPGLVFDFGAESFRSGGFGLVPGDELFARINGVDFDAHLFDTQNPVYATEANRNRWSGQIDLLYAIDAGTPLQVMFAPGGNRSGAREIFRYQYDAKQPDFGNVINACAGGPPSQTEAKPIPSPEFNRSGNWLLRPRGENFAAPTAQIFEGGFLGLVCDKANLRAAYVRATGLQNNAITNVIISDGATEYRIPAVGYNNFAVFLMPTGLQASIAAGVTLRSGVEGSYASEFPTVGGASAITHAYKGC